MSLHLDAPARSFALPRQWRYKLTNLRTGLSNWNDRRSNRSAASFFAAMARGGADYDAHIDALPEHRLIYVCVPKSASTSIKIALSALQGETVAANLAHKRRYSSLRSPSQVGVSGFYRLAMDPATLCFTFVRNPYARLVSTWADKFRDKPLVPGDRFIDRYLRHRSVADRAQPIGLDRTLSFARFVMFAIETLDDRPDPHWQLQSKLTGVAGLPLDLVGKVENFAQDFRLVLNHAGGTAAQRLLTLPVSNVSQHGPWRGFYTAELAERVHRAYSDDFFRFGYATRLEKA
ncbi:hypothetical protein ASD45_11220 [Pseudolabrys sp. Root1462]|uniref:sulfotransferase family protein n=1 Tax=Pseudolabrys sp. Root1462 TaxID=1736466 RepID=UPI0007026EA8|nr:sulfotransferase family protein [Pseudolabrys sp. Root1462]KQZ01358.1 hypothetical protein ASD45_11220 [Pseudolabrys sp. Root1462]